MTRKNCSRMLRSSLFGLVLAGALGQTWASDAARSPIVGYDRVGKPLVGGMRGNLDEAGAEARSQQMNETEAASKALVKRKTELTKRMFWIMMSMR